MSLLQKAFINPLKPYGLLLWWMDVLFWLFKIRIAIHCN